MPHCLVTGATGFIGFRLVGALLTAGHDVTCFVRRTSDVRLERLGVALAIGDVGQLNSLRSATKSVDVVFHLAGRTAAFSYRDFAAVNVAGCDHVARACAGQPEPPKLVIVSSLAAGGPSSRDRPRTERDEDAPVSRYGASKLAGERAALQYARDVWLAIVRPPWVFGPGDRAGLALFRAIRRTRLHVIPGRSDLPLSLIYVNDLIEGLMRIVSSLPSNPADGDGRRCWEARDAIYYIAHPNVTTYGEMGRLAAAAMNCPVRLLRIRKGWLLIPALWGELAGRIIRRPKLTNLDKFREARAEAWTCSTAKLTAEIGVIARQHLSDQFAETAGWYQSQGWM
jgi:nucleoside-diphosphate-sugar epimerase